MTDPLQPNTLDDLILEIMETGKELSKEYAAYDGDLDWSEYVSTSYPEGKAAIERLLQEARIDELERVQMRLMSVGIGENALSKLNDERLSQLQKTGQGADVQRPTSPTADSNQVDTYSELLTCWNCNHHFTAHIPKGTSIESYKRNTKCSNCGLGLARDDSVRFREPDVWMKADTQVSDLAANGSKDYNSLSNPPQSPPSKKTVGEEQ